MGGPEDEPWPSDLSHLRLAGRIELVDGPFDATPERASYDGVDVDETECRVVLWRGPIGEALADGGADLVALRHPQLLPILTAGYDESLGLGFVAEVVGETTLRRALGDFGPLPASSLPLVARAAAEGLAAIHAAGRAHGALSLEHLHLVTGPGGTTIQLGGLGPRGPDDLENAQRRDLEALVALLGDLGLEGVDTATSTDALVDACRDRCREGDATLVVPWRRDEGDAFAATVASGSKATTKRDEPVEARSERPPRGYAPVPSEELVGLELGGRYRLEGLLGEGGMGAVYEAVPIQGSDGGPGRVAIKLIRPGAATEETSTRFLREARLSQALDSDHVARVLEVDHDPVLGAPFMVMELLRGRDLSALLDEVSPLAPPVAARIVYEAASGLAEAHARGLVHRDVKPSNLFLHEVDGTLVTKVCDFGVAKLADHDRDATKLTRTGGLLGSPAYMAPEQARDSKRADARADVWSLGVTLYELLAGHHPWHGAGDVTELLVWLQLRDPAPLAKVAPWVDPELRAVVHRALARVADERFADASALADALEPFAGPPLEPEQLVAVAAELRAQAEEAMPTVATTHAGQAVPSTPRPRRRPWWPVVAGVTAVAGAGLLWSAAQTPDPVAPSAASASSAPTPRCRSAVACTEELGAPATCRPELGCVALEKEHCRVVGDATDPARSHDDTLWIGTMFPGAKADREMAFYGTEARRAINLARADFMSQAGGLLATESRPARPIGLIHCDDTEAPEPIAEHLLRVGVPAVIGFSSSKEVVTLASRYFIPGDTLVVPAINMGAQIAKIPHPPGTPRLVWRTVASQTATCSVANTLIADFFEPALRAEGGDGPIRVAVVRDDSAVGVALGQELFSQLRFNGASITDNGDDFRQVVVSTETADADLLQATKELAAFDPGVVVLALSQKDEVIHALESSGARATRYLFLGDLLPDSLPTVTETLPHALPRIHGVVAASSPANDRYAMHFNATYKTQLTPDNTMATPYDAFYLVAYAAFAQPEGASGGAALARGIERLLPPGDAIEVGPHDILTAFAALGEGRGIDLTGTYGPMDFDPTTGGANPRWNVVCPLPDPQAPGRVIATPSGLALDGDGSHLSGELRCPPAP